MNELLVDLLLTTIMLILYQFLIHHFVNYKKYRSSSLHTFGLFLFTYSVLISFYTAPISPTNGLHGSFQKTQLQLIPLKGFFSVFSFQKTGPVLLYVMEHLLLLMPIGFFLPLLWKSYRNWLRVTLYGFLIALTIECTQLLLEQTTDINDILWNVIGVFIGFLFFALLQAFLPGLAALTYVRRSRITKPSYLITLEPTIMVTALYIILLVTGLVMAL